MGATAQAERARLLADASRTFPHITIMPAAEMPEGVVRRDPRLLHLEQRLGPGFELMPLPGDATTAEARPMIHLAAKLPDGAIYTAQMALAPPPPRIVGPVSLTILFVVVSVGVLALWASRSLKKPLSSLASAAEDFRIDGDAPALPERGPQEIRAVADAFNRMQARVKRLVEERTRLLAALGHDLRTPITRMRLRCEFIKDDAARGPMLADLDQMKSMVESALVFLRDGQTPEPVSMIDVASSLQTICDQFTDMRHDVTYEGPGHVTIAARHDALHRAVTNLVQNAVDYGGRAVVRLTDTADAVTIAVEDDGPGIIDKNAAFEPFVRGDAARNMDHSTGFGLGLSIARAVVEKHGGTLALHDRAPTGLTAMIVLPRTAENAAAA
jgi:signal transduction histidine kinase